MVYILKCQNIYEPINVLTHLHSVQGSKLRLNL